MSDQLTDAGRRVLDECRELLADCSEEHLSALRDVIEIHARKTADYGDDADPYQNITNAARAWGLPAWQVALLKQSDKLYRLSKYAATGEVPRNDSTDDDVLDAANYGLIAYALWKRGRPEFEASSCVLEFVR